MTVHYFRERLRFAEGGDFEAGWLAIYRAHWPDMIGHFRVPSGHASAWQTRGVDRVLYLRDGGQITIDEKIRDKPWPDLLLELWSVCDYDPAARRIVQRHKLGWAVDRAKVCDYVAYAVPELGTAYLIPRDLLVRTVWRCAEKWIQNPRWYPKAAQNRGYWTVSVAVPWEVLSNALAETIRGRWPVEAGAR